MVAYRVSTSDEQKGIHTTRCEGRRTVHVLRPSLGCTVLIRRQILAPSQPGLFYFLLIWSQRFLSPNAVPWAVPVKRCTPSPLCPSWEHLHQGVAWGGGEGS